MAHYIENRSKHTLFVDGSLDSLLPEASVARTIGAALESLDFARFDARYTNDAAGRPALDPSPHRSSPLLTKAETFRIKAL
jgi:transposase